MNCAPEMCASMAQMCKPHREGPQRAVRSRCLLTTGADTRDIVFASHITISTDS